MPQSLTIGVSQSHTLATTSETLNALRRITTNAARQGVHILLYPEAYLGGYPRTCDFGSSIGARKDNGREQFLAYFNSAVDLGDTPTGAGEDWIYKRLPVSAGKEVRGDGTREELEKVAAESRVFLVVGIVERAGGSLYCGVVYVDPIRGCIGKRRKVMPTGTERLCWAQGSPETLRAVVADINGISVTLAAAICWENYMPLLRYSLYSQTVQLYFAPTADGRDTWLSLMRTIALEGRCFVLSANQCQRKSDLPGWVDEQSESKQESKSIKGHNQPGDDDNIDGRNDSESQRLVQSSATDGSTEQGSSRPRRKSIIPVDDNHELHLPFVESAKSSNTAALEDIAETDKTAMGADTEFISRGGSCIISPSGAVLAGPLWERQDTAESPDEALLVQTIDLDDCIRGRLDFDAAGSYSRNDSFRLTVKGLNLDPIV